MRTTTPLVASLSIAVYLAAAFSPCGMPDAAGWDAVTSMTRPSLEAKAHGHAAHAGMQSDAHGMASASAHSSTSENAHHQGHDAEAAPSNHMIAGSHGAPSTSLQFTAQCLCGCSDTRSFVGGTASRLGVAVPEMFQSWLLPAPRLVLDVAFVARPSLPLAGREPIPT